MHITFPPQIHLHPTQHRQNPQVPPHVPQPFLFLFFSCTRSSSCNPLTHRYISKIASIPMQKLNAVPHNPEPTKHPKASASAASGAGLPYNCPAGLAPVRDIFLTRTLNLPFSLIYSYFAMRETQVGFGSIFLNVFLDRSIFFFPKFRMKFLEIHFKTYASAPSASQRGNS